MRDSLPAIIAVWFLLSASVLAVEKSVNGRIAAIDPVMSTITVGELVLDITRKTKITLDNQNSTLANIKIGHQVKVAYDDTLEVATSIIASSKEVSAEEVLLSLQGTWLAFAEETGGKRIKKEELHAKKKSLQVEGDKFTLSTTEYRITGKIKIMADEGANAIDLAGKLIGAKSQQDVVLKSIFEVKDKTLRLCYSFNNDKQKRERPTEFETEEGGKSLSVSFNRGD